MKTLQNWSLNLSALFGPAFAKAKVKVSQFLREGNTMPAMLFVQTLVQLKAQFQLPFCSHCTQLTGSTNESCPLVKFADDTELVGKISNDEDALSHEQLKTL